MADGLVETELVEYQVVAPNKISCSKGHALADGNEIQVKHHTRYGNYLSRVCRTCAQQYKQERQLKLKAQTTAARYKPSKEELVQTMSEMQPTFTWVALGIHYGVSDVAVRKWAKQYELI